MTWISLPSVWNSSMHIRNAIQKIGRGNVGTVEEIHNLHLLLCRFKSIIQQFYLNWRGSSGLFYQSSVISKQFRMDGTRFADLVRPSKNGQKIDQEMVVLMTWNSYEEHHVYLPREYARRRYARSEHIEPQLQTGLAKCSGQLGFTLSLQIRFSTE